VHRYWKIWSSFKAKAKTLGRTIAYRPLHSENEDEMFENVVQQVGIMIMCTLDILVYLDYTTILSAQDSLQGR